jgi:hypothetical protein
VGLGSRRESRWDDSMSLTNRKEAIPAVRSNNAVPI